METEVRVNLGILESSIKRGKSLLRREMLALVLMVLFIVFRLSLVFLILWHIQASSLLWVIFLAQLPFMLTLEILEKKLELK